MKKTTYRFFATILFASLVLLFVGCTEKSEMNAQNTKPQGTDTKDENIETIDTVLQNTLNGPSDELKKMMNSQGLEDLVKYDEKLFKEHFANVTSYMEYVNSFGTTVMIDPLREGYQIKVKNIEYKKSESKEIIYDFTVELQYQKEGSDSWEVETISGEANLNDQHKIEDMIIRIGDFLGSLHKK